MGQSSPGTWQSGQHPSNGTRHIPQTSSFGTFHFHIATALTRFILTFITRSTHWTSRRAITNHLRVLTWWLYFANLQDYFCVGLLTQFVCLPFELGFNTALIKLQESQSAAAVSTDKHQQNISKTQKTTSSDSQQHQQKSAINTGFSNSIPL